MSVKVWAGNHRHGHSHTHNAVLLHYCVSWSGEGGIVLLLLLLLLLLVSALV